MKIGFVCCDTPSDERYARRLAELLRAHTTGHSYLIGSERVALERPDICHAVGLLPRIVRNGSAKNVVTLRNLNFMRHPDLFTPYQRVFVLPACLRDCRAADCLLVDRNAYREELCRRLQLPFKRVRVVPPLGVWAPQPGREAPPEQTDARLRRKYGLGRRFVLGVGLNEPVHHQKTLIDAMVCGELDIDLVLCGRRTAYADRLLDHVRANRLAARVNFIYEASDRELPALIRMASVMAYLPEAVASPHPAIAAMRHSTPMILSDTQINREVAGDAALWVEAGSVAQTAAALRRILWEKGLAEELVRRGRQAAARYDEPALARALEEVYTSL